MDSVYETNFHLFRVNRVNKFFRGGIVGMEYVSFDKKLKSIFCNDYTILHPHQSYMRVPVDLSC